MAPSISITEAAVSMTTTETSGSRTRGMGVFDMGHCLTGGSEVHLGSGRATLVRRAHAACLQGQACHRRTRLPMVRGPRAPGGLQRLVEEEGERTSHPGRGSGMEVGAAWNPFPTTAPAWGLLCQAADSAPPSS